MGGGILTLPLLFEHPLERQGPGRTPPGPYPFWGPFGPPGLHGAARMGGPSPVIVVVVRAHPHPDGTSTQIR